jgi:isoquinoline 1-oxidoreductase beta subunit
MGRIKTFSRRAFVVGSVAVVGGVAFGGWKALKTPKNPLSPPDGAALNPWLIIDQRGITVIVPRAEMGQGIQTTLAALVAEELDVVLSDINVEHGPAAQAYFNSALVADRSYELALEEKPSGWATVMADAFPKVMSLQVTGGSTSTIDAFEKMRVAGATARETLLKAASHRLNIPISQLKTKDGQVISPDNSQIPYADLAEDAAQIDPPKSPRLKPSSEWRYLGKSQPRLDQDAKVTGTAEFGIDKRLDGLLFATIHMTPHFGGAIEKIDITTAETMAGVKKIVVWEDGFGVIATNTWLAMQASDAVEVIWSKGSAPDDTEAVFHAIEAAFNDKANVEMRNQGDVDKALSSGEVIERSYRAPFLAHATMEPMNATALFQNNRLDIWTGNQSPVLIRDACADALGLKKDQVVVHTPFMGGGFGRRGTVDFALPAAKLAKEMPATPIQVTWTREEDMRHDWYRPGSICHYRAKLENGRIAALDGKMSSPSPAAPVIKLATGFDLAPEDPTITEGSHDQPYAIDHFRVRGYAPQLGIPVGFWRSVGGSQNGFFHESMIDELAYEAGADPLEFRLKHIRPEHEPAAKALETVAEMANWTSKTPRGVGRGIAHVWSYGSSVAEVINIRENDGMIEITDVWIAADLGVILDPAIVEAQLTGAAIYGLSAAIQGEITFANGAVEQGNFPDYDALRMHNTPRFHVTLLQNNRRMGGAGEAGTPPAAPALANAIFNLTGKRLREMPFSKHIGFLT